MDTEKGIRTHHLEKKRGKRANHRRAIQKLAEAENESQKEGNMNRKESEQGELKGISEQ